MSHVSVTITTGQNSANVTTVANWSKFMEVCNHYLDNNPNMDAAEKAFEADINNLINGNGDQPMSAEAAFLSIFNGSINYFKTQDGKTFYPRTYDSNTKLANWANCNN